MEPYGGEYKECKICPRECGVDRTVGPSGFCNCGSVPHIAHFGPHNWEEPPISGWLGSGTIFFSGCNLGCSFCQNKEISRYERGIMLDSEGIADIMLKLGVECHNINLVTAAHHVPTVAKALESARSRGLKVPVVYNTGSYEKASAIRRLEGLVDIYLPDLKYASRRLGSALSNAPDYFEVATEAIIEMHRQVGHLMLDDDGIAVKGMLIRHLIMPGETEDSFLALEWIRKNIGKYANISIMSQYTPDFLDDQGSAYARLISDAEYSAVIGKALDLGLENIFTQELTSAKASYVPHFNQLDR